MRESSEIGDELQNTMRDESSFTRGHHCGLQCSKKNDTKTPCGTRKTCISEVKKMENDTDCCLQNTETCRRDFEPRNVQQNKPSNTRRPNTRHNVTRALTLRRHGQCTTHRTHESTLREVARQRKVERTPTTHKLPPKLCKHNVASTPPNTILHNRSITDHSSDQYRCKTHSNIRLIRILFIIIPSMHVHHLTFHHFLVRHFSFELRTALLRNPQHNMTRPWAKPLFNKL